MRAGTWVLCLFCMAYAPICRGYDLLPYTNRTHPYNAWSASPLGDLRTVGMAGATVGLANSFIAAMDNPAGLAMALANADGQFISDTITDATVQNPSYPLQTYDMGIAFPIYPWGFSLGYFSHTFENQPYATNADPNNPMNMAIATQEFRVSLAHLFFKNRLSLGASVIFGQGSSMIQYGSNPFLLSTSGTVSATLGATYQLDGRWLIGLSYNPPHHYDVGTGAIPTTGVTNFFQPLQIPAKLGLGLGWIPNRYFNADFTTFIIGANNNTALLKDDQTLIGQAVTLQPRLGLSYHWLNYKELHGILYLGTYYEGSRIQNTPDRLHGTFGFDLHPWIFDLGVGLDSSTNYKNYLLSFGLNISKLFEKLSLIPSEQHPPQNKILPRPDRLSEEGLPRPLVKNWNPKEHVENPENNFIQVGLNLPVKLEKKIRDISQAVGKVLADDTKKAKPKKQQKKKLGNLKKIPQK